MVPTTKPDWPRTGRRSHPLVPPVFKAVAQAVGTGACACPHEEKALVDRPMVVHGQA